MTEPDANDNALSTELLTYQNNTYGLNIRSGTTIVGKLNFTETLGTTTRLLNLSVGSVQFIETGMNTGVFELRIDLQTGLNGTRTSGWQIKASYYDSFNKVTVTATSNIGGALATIALDRTTLPTNPGNAITVKITLTDSDANVNIAAIDTTTVTLNALNATNQIVNFNGPTTGISITVTESGQNTGIFTGSYTYNLLSATGAVIITPSGGAARWLVNVGSGNVTGSLMIGGKLNATLNHLQLEAILME
ncbi:hypothetical protein ACFL96_18485 [Thermoproteota archaeon]